MPTYLRRRQTNPLAPPVFPTRHLATTLELGLWSSMDYEFNANEWGALMLLERAERCRLLSAEMYLLAQKAPPELRLLYEHIAEQWEKLASEITRHASLGEA